MIGENVTLDGVTSSTASSSCSASAATNKQSNTLAQMTDLSNTRSDSAKSNNLDVALQAFIQRFVPSHNGTIGQILQGITRNAESVWMSNTTQTSTPHTTSGPCAVSSMTVVHKLDQFTEKLVKENMELREENEVLKAQIATLTKSQTTVTVEGICTNLSSPASKSPQNTTPTPHSASPVSDP